MAQEIVLSKLRRWRTAQDFDKKTSLFSTRFQRSQLLNQCGMRSVQYCLMMVNDRVVLFLYCLGPESPGTGPA